MFSVTSIIRNGAGQAGRTDSSAPGPGASGAAAAASLATPAPASTHQTAASAPGQGADSVDAKAMLAAQLQALQAKMDTINPELSFVLDQADQRTIIQLTDRNTKEVIQQFPSTAVLQIARELDRYEGGRLLNKKA